MRPNVVLGVLCVYGLAMGAVRDGVYTQQAEMQSDLGMSDADVSRTLAVGYAVYALGKLTYGTVVDHIGGRWAFTASFALAALATAAFALCTDATSYTLCWVASRVAQPAAWLGVCKLAALWYPYTRLGTIFAVIGALTYVFDAGVRFGIGGLRALGVTWRLVFVACASIALLVALAAACLLRASPELCGLDSPPRNPHGAGAREGVEHSPKHKRALRERLAMLLTSRDFVLVCLLGCALGTVREIFLCFLSQMLRHSGAGDSLAIALSGTFPLLGVPGLVVCGSLVDRYDRRRNGAIVAVNTGALFALAAALYTLKSLAAQPPLWAVVLLTSGIGFVVIGPYNLCAGVFSTDLGADAGVALATGIIDFSTYVGAIAFTAAKGAIKDDLEVLAVVLGVCAVAFTCSLAMVRADHNRAVRRSRRRRQQRPNDDGDSGIDGDATQQLLVN